MESKSHPSHSNITYIITYSMIDIDILNNLNVKNKGKGHFNYSLCMCVGLHMCLHTCKDPRLVLAYSLSQDLSHT